jgi:DNA-binding GntR family transcriptional regulator
MWRVFATELNPPSLFHERLLTQGRRMLHTHFSYSEHTPEGYLPTDDHETMIATIKAKDVDRADELAHLHTGQFGDTSSIS